MLPFKGPLSFQLVDTLCNQILLNMKLLHLDLSHIDISTDDILLLGDSMRKSKSLVSVHLSGNNLSVDMIEQIKVKLKMVSNESEEDFDNYDGIIHKNKLKKVNTQ